MKPSLVRVGTRVGARPLGGIFGGIGVLAAAGISLLHVDRLPVTLCVFKGLTGLPCPTCGSTRALGRLFALDFPGALAMNPFITLVAVVVGAWAVADLILLPARRALDVSVAPRLGLALRVGALVLFLANWVYLMAAGR